MIPVDILKRTVIVAIEPSKRLSEIMGFPYFVERKFTVEELLSKGVITEREIEAMKSGEQIMKKMKVSREGVDHDTSK